MRFQQKKPTGSHQEKLTRYDVKFLKITLFGLLGIQILLQDGKSMMALIKNFQELENC